MTHKVNVVLSSKKTGRESILRTKTMCLPQKLLHLLFGESTQIFILQPGQTVSAVEIHEERSDAIETV